MVAEGPERRGEGFLAACRGGAPGRRREAQQGLGAGDGGQRALDRGVRDGASRVGQARVGPSRRGAGLQASGGLGEARQGRRRKGRMRGTAVAVSVGGVVAQRSLREAPAAKSGVKGAHIVEGRDAREEALLQLLWLLLPFFPVAVLSFDLVVVVVLVAVGGLEESRDGGVERRCAGRASVEGRRDRADAHGAAAPSRRELFQESRSREGKEGEFFSSSAAATVEREKRKKRNSFSLPRPASGTPSPQRLRSPQRAASGRSRCWRRRAWKRERRQRLRELPTE